MDSIYFSPRSWKPCCSVFIHIHCVHIHALLRSRRSLVVSLCYWNYFQCTENLHVFNTERFFLSMHKPSFITAKAIPNKWYAWGDTVEITQGERARRWVCIPFYKLIGLILISSILLTLFSLYRADKYNNMFHTPALFYWRHCSLLLVHPHSSAAILTILLMIVLRHE